MLLSAIKQHSKYEVLKYIPVPIGPDKKKPAMMLQYDWMQSLNLTQMHF